MQLRNHTPPHLQEKPCRKCKRKTKALHNGQIQQIVTCEACKKEEEKIFELAKHAANRQAINRAHRKIQN